MSRPPGIDRRAFLVRAGAVGGTLTLGFAIPFGAPRARAENGTPEINAWIVIAPDDSVIIRVAKAEMGQGAFTALPMLVAEELECDWRKVKPEFVRAHENARRGRVWGNMSTGASRGISSSQQDLRRAGATAREMLIAAAAARWNVPAAECTAANSVITHRRTGRRLTFAAVAAAAAAMPAPKHVRLKDPNDWKLIGTAQPRFEVGAKVTGQPIYAIDVRLPNMLYATILQCPVFKGRLKAVDASKLSTMKGVRRVVQLPDAVAVVADNWWRAKKAADALTIAWDPGEGCTESSAQIRDSLQSGLDAAHAGVGRSVGNVDAALAQAAKRIDADYEVPFLAHATMEPQNCTASVSAGRVEVWAPTQDAETARATAANAAGVPNESVIVHPMMLGGGFGRRGMMQDFVRQAVLIAKDVGQPVKLIWTREEDTRHDFYRPAVAARMSAGLDAEGMPVAWKIRTTGQSIMATIAPHILRFGADKHFLQGLLEDNPYQVPNYFIDFAMRATHVPVGVWRSVNHSQNAFFKECFIDEMAHAAEVDPYRYRRRLLAQAPRYLAVLDAVAEKSGWTKPAPDGIARGLALHESQGTICAHVVEVSISPEGTVRIPRVVVAIDAGHVVNPLSVEMQCESAIVYGLTAALYGEITIRDGQVEQSNFGDYRMLRLDEMPRIETVIVPSSGIWGGVGEPPLPPLAPALCNAVFAATGKRVRSLPLKNHDLRKA